MMFQYRAHKKRMLSLMFQHHTNKQIIRKKINDKKVKGTVSSLTQFGDKHTYSRGYQIRKEIHWCSPYSKVLSKPRLQLKT